MKRHWDSLIAVLGLALGVATMACTIVSGEYAHAAGAEARGYDALFHIVADARRDAKAGETLVASNEVTR
jgi:hypothetical protein